MRKIVAGLFVSADGVVEAPPEWITPYFNDEMAQALESGMANSDAMLLGRRTYQEFEAYWPQQGNDVPFAEHTNSVRKLVVSTTLKSVHWHNSILLNGTWADELRALKRHPGKTIQVVGSPTLVRSLVREQLLDELALLVPPVLVGAGQRLFEDAAAPVPLKLIDSKTFSNGVLSLTYEVTH